MAGRSRYAEPGVAAFDDTDENIRWIELRSDPATARYVWVNDEVCDLTGYSRDELLAMGPSDLLVDHDPAWVASRYRAIQASDGQVMDVQIRCKDGCVLDVIARVRLNRATGLVVARARLAA